MRALCCLALVVRHAAQRVVNLDPLDDQDLVLEVDLAFGLGGQLAAARVDPARLQRATEGAGESTRRRGDDVVESRGVLGVLAGSGAVVLTDGTMGAERDGLVFGRQVGLADRPALADDPDLAQVCRVRSGFHLTRLTGLKGDDFQ
jgi:hypothetical protein